MKTYFEFNGTAKRQEYWGVLAAVIVAYVVGIIALEGAALGALFAIVIFVAAIWAQVATTVRRLRDAGLDPLWVLVTVVPYVGSIATLAFGWIPSKEEDDTVDSVEEQ
jgi:uncharacterized membrane protein YhaH (DUF805 family)